VSRATYFRAKSHMGTVSTSWVSTPCVINSFYLGTREALSTREGDIESGGSTAQAKRGFTHKGLKTSRPLRREPRSTTRPRRTALVTES
jgi:hypothetical protein